MFLGRLSHLPRRHADNTTPSGDIVNDHGAGADHGPRTDTPPRQHDRPRSHQRARPDRRPPEDAGPWGHMRIVADRDVMLDHRRAVDKYAGADARRCVDHGTGKHDRPCADNDPTADRRARMAHRRQRKPRSGRTCGGKTTAIVVADAEGGQANAAAGESGHRLVIAEKRQIENAACFARRDQAGDRNP